MIHVVGLGPGDWDGTDETARRLLSDGDRVVVVRTRSHPASETLASRRSVTFCDDLYERSEAFEDVYSAIAERVVDTARDSEVVYAVPGSPTVGEFAVGLIRERARAAGIPVEVHPATSFLDACCDALGIDPLRDGLRLLNGHELTEPFVFDVPTVIAHIDLPEVLADVAARIDRVLPEDAEICVLSGLGSADATIVWGRPVELDPSLAGVRTSLFVPVVDGGVLGAIRAMDRLRAECPWDRVQTHHSLVRYLMEESHELADALSALGDGPDLGAYADVEEELGDLLLQVLFHSVIAREAGAFDIGDVAEQLRRKLVRRHPHVFGDTEAADAEAVKQNWDAIKASEKQVTRESLMDGIPTSLPVLQRAAEVQRRAKRIGFDWDAVDAVMAKLGEEVSELAAVLGDPTSATHEMGDVLFSIVNVARHLDVDPEIAARSAVQRFEERFRAMESMADLDGLSLGELDALWERAKDS